MSTVNRQYSLSGPRSCKVMWELCISDSVLGNTAKLGMDNNIIIGTKNGNLLSVLPSGTIGWTIDLGMPLSCPSVGTDGTIYVGTSDAWKSTHNKVFAVNKHGAIAWSLDIGGSALFPPVMDQNNALLIVTEDSKLYCIDLQGHHRWTYEGKDGFWLLPTVSPERLIYIADQSEILHVLNADGQLQYQLTVGIGQPGSMAIWTQEGDILFNSNLDKQIEMLRVRKMKVDRMLSLGKDEDLWSSPSFSSQGTIYVPANFFRLLAVNLEGTRLWEMKVEGFINSPPIIGQDGMIYFTTIISSDGAGESCLYCVSPSGLVVWSHKIDGEATTPAIGSDRTLYVLTNESMTNRGKLIAISE